MKKIGFIFLLSFSSVIISCWPCRDIEPHFQINSMKSINLKNNITTELSNNDTVYWEDYFIRISFDVDYITSLQNKRYYSSNSLFALSCEDPGYEGSKVGVKNIEVIALNHYNSNFLKNDTINPIVRITNQLTIDEYLEENNQSIKAQYLDFRLDIAPDSVYQTSQFHVVYKLQNGEKFETTTSPVVLRK